MKVIHLLFFSLVFLMYPMIESYAESTPIFVYSEQVSRLGNSLNVCYQLVDINAKPISETGIVLSALQGSTSEEQNIATDANGIAITSFAIQDQSPIYVKVSKVFGNYTYSSDYDTKVILFDTGVKSEPKNTQIPLTSNPSMKKTCVDETQSIWEIWDQDGTTTTYYDLNTWTVVKTDKTNVLEISQGGKPVNAKISLASWQKDIDSILVKNGFAPTANQGVIHNIATSDTIKKSDHTHKTKETEETKKTEKKQIKPEKKQIKKIKTIKVKYGQTINEKISGTIPVSLYKKGQPADVTILKPDGKIDMQKIAVSNKGKFEHLFIVTDKTMVGKYEITISYSGTNVKTISYLVQQ